MTDTPVIALDKISVDPLSVTRCGYKYILIIENQWIK